MKIALAKTKPEMRYFDKNILLMSGFIRHVKKLGYEISGVDSEMKLISKHA